MAEPKQLDLLENASLPETLSPKETLFLRAYLDCRDNGKAWMKLNPRTSPAAAAVSGSRAMKRIKAKLSRINLVDEFGLGIERLLSEIDAGLRASRPYGKKLLPDWSARLGYTKLLGAMHNIQETSVQVNTDNRTLVQVMQQVHTERRGGPDA